MRTIAHTHSLNIMEKEGGADITQIFSLDVVDGAGVGHSGEQIVEMCAAAGWDGQITLTLSLHLISIQKILHWEHSTLHTQRHLLVDEWIISVTCINNHDWRSFTKKATSSLEFAFEENRKD